jgi:hypothetical protein
MAEEKVKVKVEIGSVGLALADMLEGTRGPAYFKGYGQVEVKALEQIHKYREVVIVSVNNEVVEKIYKTIS